METMDWINSPHYEYNDNGKMAMKRERGDKNFKPMIKNRKMTSSCLRRRAKDKTGMSAFLNCVKEGS